jgi:copper transport protein
VLKRASVAIAVVLAALAAAPSTFAHATLQQSSPAGNAIVRESPPTVTLQFSEAVETAFGSIRVYDCGGERVDSGKVDRPSESSVAVNLDRKLPAGTYTVTWRVISADSHPVAGAFVFSVKAASKSGECKQVFGKEGTPGSIDALFKFVRALDFALILLVVGGATALALVLRSAAPELRAMLYRILAGLALGLVVACILCIVLQGAVAGGFGLSEAFRWDTVDSVLQTRFGEAFLWQLGLAAVIAPGAFLVSRSSNSIFGLVILVPAVLLLPTLSAAGHARTSGTVALIADVVHIAAASVWVGGLAFTVLALLLAGADRWPLASRAVPVFSILAVGSVVTLIIAGTIRGYEEVKAFHGLWDTTYGKLLLLKIGLVLPLLALGAYNNRFAVPRLKRQIASALEQRRFLRAAGVELAIMAAIVGVTAVLVTEPPAKASVEAPKFVNAFVPIGNLEVNYTIDPAKTGPNTIHLYFFEPAPSGAPANVDDAKMSATLPSENVGPIAIPLQKIVPSHYTTPAGVFPQAGDWQVLIEARRGEFEALTQTVTVPIREG